MRKYKGFEKVDAYLIPKKEAGRYKRNRKRARKLALAGMRTFCDKAYTAFAGSQDGEAVIGMKGDKMIAFIHLDPDGVERILSAKSNEELIKILQEV